MYISNVFFMFYGEWDGPTFKLCRPVGVFFFF